MNKINEQIKLRKQVESEVAFKQWLVRKKYERRKHRKSRSLSRQSNKEKMSSNYSSKYTPRSCMKTSKYSDTKEDRYNMRRSKNKELSRNISSKASRSGSSRKRKYTSSKKSSKKKRKNSRKRSNSKNSSRRALGFEGIETDSKSKEPNRFASNKYLMEKYNNLMNRRKDLKSRKYKKFKSPSFTSRNVDNRKNNDWKKVCNSNFSKTYCID